MVVPSGGAALGRASSVGHHVAVRTRAALGVLSALLLAAAGCGRDGNSAGVASDTTAVDAAATAFCEAWNAALVSGDEPAILDVLAGAPEELEAAAAIVRDADTDRPGSPQAEAASAQIMNWTELHCRAGEGARSRRIAPPVGVQFDGVTFCGTSAFPSAPTDGRSGMVLYGASDADDPYDGPMLGLLWNPADGGGFGGDGPSEPVTVRGQRGVAAPITVFQQAVIPELGTVVAWTEGDRSFGLYGRGWPMERAHELVAIADRLETDGDGVTIPDHALPEGFAEIVAGDPSLASLVLPPSPVYSLRYRGDGGLLELSGLEQSEAEFEAFRFLTVGVDRGDAGGRDGLAGGAWYGDGPAVVTWREPDGLVVRVVGIGVPIEVVREVAAEARELTDVEWAALVEAEDRCQQR